MKKYVIFFLVLFLTTTLFAQNIFEWFKILEPGTIDYNRTKLVVGDVIWINGVDLGDGPWVEDVHWFDKNGYIYPHHFGNGESGKLRPAVVVQVLDKSPHRNHPRLKIKVRYPWSEKEYEHYSYKVISEQRVVLINW